MVADIVVAMCAYEAAIKSGRGKVIDLEAVHSEETK